MKKYKIRILINSGDSKWWTEEIITANLVDYGNNYIFCDNDGLHTYYPITNTIVEELAPEKVTQKVTLDL